jgi:hypothetical protein
MRAWLIALLMVLIGASKGQTSWGLGQSVQYAVKAGPVSKALENLERSCACRFSYNPDLLPDSVAADSWQGITFREGLDRMLGEEFAYRERASYIIIRHLGEAEIHQGEQIYALTGYVRDAQTGQAIPFATVYDTASLQTALSGSDGYYELSVPDTANRVVRVQLPDQRDTFIDVSPLHRAQTYIDKRVIPTIQREIQAAKPIVEAAVDTLVSKDFWNRQVNGIRELLPDSLTRKTPSSPVAKDTVEPVQSHLLPDSTKKPREWVALGLNANTYNYLQGELQLGLPQIYSRILYSPSQLGNQSWGLGLGIGAQMGYRKPMGCVLDAAAQYYFSGQFTVPAVLFSAAAMPSIRLGENVRLVTGPEINVLSVFGTLTNKASGLPTRGIQISPEPNEYLLYLFASWRVSLVIR